MLATYGASPAEEFPKAKAEALKASSGRYAGQAHTSRSAYALFSEADWKCRMPKNSSNRRWP